MSEKTVIKKLHPSGSLTRRVILVCLTLLVIPLFFHTIFLYRTEYQARLTDIKMILQVIGEAQVALIRERVVLEWNRLDAVGSGRGPIARKLGVTTIPLPEGAEGNFVLADDVSKNLVVGKRISDQNALAILTPLTPLIDDLTHFGESPYPVSLAISRSDGKFLAGEIEDQALTTKLAVPNSNLILILTVPESSIKALHFQEYLLRFLALIFLIGVIGGVLVWLLTRRIAKPLRSLCRTMDRVSEGAAHARYTPDRMGFEINELGQQFNQTLDALLTKQKEIEQERVVRERLAEELKIGREIQLSLLPKNLPDWNDLDVSAGFLPATEVSGDFYDLFPIQEGRLFIVIADTAGKGISACLFSLGLRSLLRALLTVKPNLSEALFEANHLLGLDTQESGMFVTLWAGIYDKADQSLTYCSQGHPPAILKRRGALQMLGTKGIAIGAGEWGAVATQQIQLQPQDLLFLCTDGVIEAHNTQSELFGQKRLEKVLEAIDGASSESVVNQVFEEVRVFAQAAKQHDDMTCLSIQIL